jgi:tetratricopeptide (TPR) repeat protein
VLRLKDSDRQKAGRLWPLLIVFLLAIPAILLSQVIRQEITDALASGDTTLAVSLLEKDIKLDPSYGYNYYTLGQIYLRRGKYQEAERQFQLSFDKDGKFLEGLLALGTVQVTLGKLDEAIKNFNIGLKKSKDTMKAAFYNGLGIAHMAQGELNSADREIRQALILDSVRAEYHTSLGDINFQNKVYPLALSEYEKALELDTASLDVYFHMAEAYLELKDYSAALEKLNFVLRKDSTHAEAWMKAGGIYYKAARSARNPEDARQRYRDAIGSYKKYIELTTGKPDSTTGRAYYETAMAYLMIGGYAEAKQYYATVLGIPVEPKDIYFYYGRAFFGNGEYDSAVVYFNKQSEWVKKQPDGFQSSVSEGELNRWMGEASENLKDYQSAVTYYLKSLAFDSTQERVLYGLAVSYNYLGDYRNALIYYIKRIALGVDEKLWHIYYNAATSAMYLAEKSAQTPEQKEPPKTDSTSAVNPIADPLAGVDFSRLAASYLEKVVEYKPENIKAAGLLASIYLYQLSDCANGVKLYEKVLALDSENCEAMKSLGYAYFGGICQKNYTRALEYLNKALRCTVKKNNSECSDANLLTWIAQVYEFRAMEKEEAREKVEAKKDYKAAFDWYNKVIKCEPGNKSALDGIDRVKFKY